LKEKLNFRYDPVPAPPKAYSLFGRGQLRVRVAEPRDTQTIAELTNCVFREKENRLKTLFTTVSEVERLMRHGKFLVAEVDDALLGYAYLEPRVEASRLEILAVSPQRQRTGIGSQLLDAAERMSRGMKCFYLHVNVVNINRELVRFCRNRGYIEFGLQSLNEDEAISPHCHIIKMSKHLELDRLAF
jgi:GNAT superfamily N-acetyltransferase